MRTVLLPAIFLSVLVATLAPATAQTGPCFAAFDGPNFLPGVTTGGPNLSIGIKSTNGTSTLLVFAAEVFTGGGSGSNGVAIWTHDAVNNRPGRPLGIGTFGLQNARIWQGANLTVPVLLSAGQDFWFVWSVQNGQFSSIERSNRTSGQPYRGSFDGGQTWNGPFVNYDWKLRLWCGPIGEVSTFGTACPGSARTQPRLGSSGAPSLGNPFSLHLTNALANSSAVAFLGFSDRVLGGSTPLPLHLGPFGATGCFVLIDLVADATLPTDPSGAASLNLVVPNSSALIGTVFFGQWIVADPAANTLGIATSEGGRFVIGS
ncbi:MAG: hypothetical protein IT457_04595 [Planctomycetes bacterium]|nr:hypothetical protein [Planctomycetota bacterium]